MTRDPDRFTRRAVLKGILCGASLAAASTTLGCLSRTLSDPEPSPTERDAMLSVAHNFMSAFHVPGLSIAIARHGRLLYEVAIGFANLDAGEILKTDRLFRIASVSKPITSTAIFTLIERGKLGQNDRVFGSGGILGTKFGSPPYRSWVEDITMDHLLTHTCGGWDNSYDDPMFQNAAMDHAQLISWTVDTQPLKNPPGAHYAYSNFGYCVLGRIIEQVSGQPYHDFVQEEILNPCGVHDMRIAGNTLSERAPREVAYYDQNGGDPDGMNVARMDSHGGWLATPRDLVLFLGHVDGFNLASGILKPETIKRMTTPSSINASYARGWAVNNVPNWWHNGSLPGTSTIMVRTALGFCWAALTNTRITGQPDIGLALDNMVWNMVRKVSVWRV